MQNEPDREVSIRDLRLRLADVINDASAYNHTTYITNRGRRVAAVVPVLVADAAREGRS